MVGEMLFYYLWGGTKLWLRQQGIPGLRPGSTAYDGEDNIKNICFHINDNEDHILEYLNINFSEDTVTRHTMTTDGIKYLDLTYKQKLMVERVKADPKKIATMLKKRSFYISNNLLTSSRDLFFIN
jgi:hypothetical protein